MAENRIFKMKWADMLPLYVAKAEKKGRTPEEVREVISWLTGYSAEAIQQKAEDAVDLETFFTLAPEPNPKRVLITGSICGVKISEIEDPIMKEVRYMDKLIDELSKGKDMDKILRK